MRVLVPHECPIAASLIAASCHLMYTGQLGGQPCHGYCVVCPVHPLMSLCRLLKSNGNFGGMHCRFHTRLLPLSADVDLRSLAASCHGYSGADLAALAREGAMHAFAGATSHLLRHTGGPLYSLLQQQRSSSAPAPLQPPPPPASATGSTGGPGQPSTIEAAAADAAGGLADGSPWPQPAAVEHQAAVASTQTGGAPSHIGRSLPVSMTESLLQHSSITMADFNAAMKQVGPSIVRGAEAEYVPISWDEIGGLQEVKKRLRQAVEWPMKHAGRSDDSPSLVMWMALCYVYCLHRTRAWPVRFRAPLTN